MAEADTQANNLLHPTWFQTLLNDTYASNRSIIAIEDALASAASLSYGLVIDRYRKRYMNGDEGVNSLWAPEFVTLHGIRPVLSARLKINAHPLFVCLLATTVLTVTSLRCWWGRQPSRI